jgi:hypothetical protein
MVAAAQQSSTTHDVEALVGEAADRGGDALIGEDPGDRQPSY